MPELFLNNGVNFSYLLLKMLWESIQQNNKKSNQFRITMFFIKLVIYGFKD